MKGVYIFLAGGFEPIEALAPMDVLRRARIEAKFVATQSSTAVSSTQGYPLMADLSWKEFLKESANEGIECMIFPGGLPGADTLGANRELAEMLKEHFTGGGLTCAICAAPARVLAADLGALLSGRKMTVYEGFETELLSCGAVPTGENVTVDGNLITAKGPGLAIDFGLAILENLADIRVHDIVKHAMML